MLEEVRKQVEGSSKSFPKTRGETTSSDGFRFV